MYESIKLHTESFQDGFKNSTDYHRESKLAAQRMVEPICMVNFRLGI